MSRDQPTELDKLLQKSREQGQVESEGSFTMDRDKALDKLAKYQLPFPEAWALKIIQSIVASRENTGIDVALLWKETRFTFTVESWNLDDIERDFFKVDEDREDAYTQLTRGLWPVALGEKRGFCLTLPGELDALVWDGDRLNRVPIEHMPKQAELSVSLFPSSKNALDEIKIVGSYASKNQELFAAFRRHCYTCPLPLTVDSQRIDALQKCPNFGLAEMSMPLLMGETECELTSLRIPPGSFEKRTQSKSLLKMGREFFSTKHDEFGVQKFGEKVIRETELSKEATLPYLASFRMKYDKSKGWNQRPGLSALFWVKDGVVVDVDYLNSVATYCSLGAFANADSLPTDLTGFKLRETVERTLIMQDARRAIHQNLREQRALLNTLEESIRRREKGAKVTAWGGATLGVLAIFAVPALVFPVAFLGGGLWNGEYRKMKKLERVHHEVSILIDSLSL